MKIGTFCIISPISRCMVFFTSAATIMRVDAEAEEMEGLESKIMLSIEHARPLARPPY